MGWRDRASTQFPDFPIPALGGQTNAVEERRVLQDLEREERMRLMKFVCSFAWADLEIHPDERAYIARMVQRIQLNPEEQKQVALWLQVPPHVSEIDPTTIPRAHRATFVESILGLIEADGVVSEEERDNFELFENLLR